MTFNYWKIRGKIWDKFGTIDKFAQHMDLSYTSVSNRLNGKLQWTQADIAKAIEVLGLEKSDITDYFFNTEEREV